MKQFLCVGDDIFTNDYSDIIHWTSTLSSTFLVNCYCDGAKGRKLTDIADIINNKISDINPDLVLFNGGICDIQNGATASILVNQIEKIINDILNKDIHCLYVLMPINFTEISSAYRQFAANLVKLQFNSQYKPVLNLMDGTLGTATKIKEDIFIQDLQLSSAGNFAVADAISAKISKTILKQQAVDQEKISGAITVNTDLLYINLGTQDKPDWKNIIVEGTNKNSARTLIEWRF